ncbi:hypothetical protein [Peribacillus frigoritolerans]|uniref:Uncharacterized protein n=1 Tax=Peribacillus frigoritolerans TaxID=450367 RepID=A0AAJ1QRC2_9BACI|nr:hypothetical protein [Peribacillus frigoritolerans]MDM5285664.1 hypothetical protein [Peribacillus frigoritolerans]
MSEYWQLEKCSFAFYTENLKVMRSINRSYSDRIRITAEYFKDGKLRRKQYRFGNAELRRIRGYIASE